LNDGSPFLSTATISLSTAVWSGRRSNARVTVGNRSLKFFVAGCEVSATVALDPDSAVAVQFELQLPFRTLGQFGNREAEHRFEETGVHFEEYLTTRGA